MIPIILFLVAGFVGFTFSPIGQAIARRIGAGKADPQELEELRSEVAELRADVAEQQGELDEMRSRVTQMDELQGRVDFAERLLAQAKSHAVRGGEND